MGFASGGGSNRDDEGSSGAERGGFGGWGGSRNEHGGGGDQRDSWSSRQKEDKAREEAEREAREKAARDAEKDTRRSVNPNTEVEESRSFLSRIRDLFSDDEMTNQVASADEGVNLDKKNVQRTIYMPSVGEVTEEDLDRIARGETIGDVQRIDLGVDTAFDVVGGDVDTNPYSEYAESVARSGLVGDEQTEKDLAKEISDAGRTAQGFDVASTFGSAIAGLIGAVPSLAHSLVTSIDDDPIQQAGESLYEGGKVNVPGVSTAVSGVFGGIAGTAYDVANEIFGGSRDLGAFEEAAGVQRDQQITSPSNDFGGDSGNDRSAVITPQPLAEPPPTMASTFSQSSLGNNVYSDFLDNFFKQG